MNLLVALSDYGNPNSLGSRLRAKRAVHLKSLIERIAAAQGRCRIIDLGGHPVYWNIIGRDFLIEKRCQVTLYNASANELRQNPVADDALVTGLIGDACAVHFADNDFDLVHSNSTIEHVGEWPRMLRFAQEVRRLAPAYFVQTPNFWFPIEPHFGAPFWAWLPEPVRVWLLLRRGWGYFPKAKSVPEAIAAVQEIHLLDRRAFAELFPDARIVDEKFAGMTKSLIAIRDGAGR